MSAKNVLELLSGFDLRGLRLKNRIVMAPMTRSRSGADRIPKQAMAIYYAQRASAGLIVSEGVTISEEANGWNETPGLYTEAMASAWRPVVEAVHEKGGKIFAQLWHTGRASHSAFHNGQLPVAASAIAIAGDHIHTPAGKKAYEVPRALETNEISRVVGDYRAAARHAKVAGFDGVELHGANGYLIDNFLQSKTNQRTDAYGGSIENRYRFLKEIVEAVALEWPANRIGVRLSPNGVFNDMGSPEYRESYTYYATQLDQYGLSYLHVMDGLAFGFHNLGQPMTLADFRKVFHGPLMGNCGYELASAEAAVSSGAADLIAFGRPFISNPDLVDRFAHGWPLNPPADMAAWYTPGPKGYADFPTHSLSN